MRPILFLCLYFLVGCATKYIIPGNRFITPETQGAFLRGQFELQQTSATQLAADLTNNSVTEGVSYSDVSRLGFLYSNSFFDKLDFVWSHTGGGNSLFGGKIQLLGDSKVSKGTGHKLGLAFLTGSNEYQTDDRSLKFELGGKEFLILYGYRISENILPYASFSYATFNFDGTISSSNPSQNGLKPSYATKARGLNSGFEFSYLDFSAKLEASYQRLNTDNTKEKKNFIYGYSFGYSW